jgi:tetratricopeptide (TPR) repeat protein
MEGRHQTNDRDARGWAMLLGQRLHSASRYVTPGEFEKSVRTVEMTARMESLENQVQASQRFRRYWKSLRAALAIEPWYTRAEELLADIYLQKREYGQARTNLEHILSVDPDNYTAHHDLGVLAAMQENWTEAQQQVLSALRTESGSAEAHNVGQHLSTSRGSLAGLFRSILCLGSQPAADSPIVPVPREITNSRSSFVRDEQMTIALPISPRAMISNKGFAFAVILSSKNIERQ